MSDIEARKQWSEYQKAYEMLLAATHTPWAPWTIVPANSKTPQPDDRHTGARSAERAAVRYPGGLGAGAFHGGVTGGKTPRTEPPSPPLGGGGKRLTSLWPQCSRNGHRLAPCRGTGASRLQRAGAAGAAAVRN